MQPKAQANGSTATLVYSADSLDKIKAPWLKHGDEKAKREFEEAYLKYCAKHDRVMRGRPLAHRILPKAVVECMDPDLLEYVCARAIPNTGNETTKMLHENMKRRVE